MSTHRPLETRLSALASFVPEDETFVTAVLARLEIEPAPIRARLRRWGGAASIAVAAGVTIAAGAWWLLVSAPPPAYALADMPRQLLSLRSLHLRGTNYDGTGRAVPFEMFAQTPERLRSNGEVATTNGRITRSYVSLVSPDGELTIDDANRTVRRTPLKHVDVEFRVAQILQVELASLFHLSPDWHLVRTEPEGGRALELYRRDEGVWKLDLWFNPATGLPVKMRQYQADEAGKGEQLLFSLDTIEPDPVLPTDTFNVGMPVGYRQLPSDTAAEQEPFNRLVVQDEHVSVRFAMELGNATGDVLLCWDAYDGRAPEQDLEPSHQPPVEFSATTTGGEPYSVLSLRTDPTPGKFHWHWSRLRPKRVTTEQADCVVSLGVKEGGSSGRLSQFALRFPPPEIARLVHDCQAATMPPGGVPLNLEEIERAK